MKLKNVSIFCIALIFLMSTFAFGSVIEVTAGTDKISAAYEQAEPGDVLLLTTDGGNYIETDVLRVEKDITIRGARGLTEKPTWYCDFGSTYDATLRFGEYLIATGEDMKAAAIENYSDSDLYLSNLVMSGLSGDHMPQDQSDSTYAAIHNVSHPSDTMDHKYELIVDNVDFHYFHADDDNGAGLYMEGLINEVASLIKITNCRFYDNGQVVHIDPQQPAFGYDRLILKNNTAAKSVEDHPIHIETNADPDTTHPVTIIDHNTLVGSGDDMIKGDAFFEYRVENNILWNVGDNVLSTFSDSGSVYFNYNTIKYEGSIATGWSNIEPIGDSTAIDTTYPFAKAQSEIDQYAGVDSDYSPMSDYDFTLSNSAAQTLIGSDGYPLGDQRWVPSDVEISDNNVIEVSEGTDKISDAYANAESGDVILLTTDGGNYIETSVLRVQKDITIRGAKGLSEKPTWYCDFGSTYDGTDNFSKYLISTGEDMKAAAIENYTNSDLYLSNLAITGLSGDHTPQGPKDSTHAAIHNVSLDTLEHKYKLVVDNVDFHYFHADGDDGAALHLGGLTNEVAHLIEITNSRFYDNGQIVHISPQEPDFAYDQLILENNTAAKSVDDHPLHIETNAEPGADHPATIINHNTLVGSGDDMIKGDELYEYRVENNILWNVGDNVLSTFSDSGSVYFRNNTYDPNASSLASGWSNIEPIKKAKNDTIYPFANSQADIDSYAGVDSDYSPMSDYDFTLSDNAATGQIGTDGYPVGDQRWVPEGTEVDVEDRNKMIPDEFKVYQNYPNPFNPITTIKYSLREQTKVRVSIYNILGEKVETLVNESKNTGTHRIEWNATNIPSGVYFYRIKAGNKVKTNKMLLLK